MTPKREILSAHAGFEKQYQAYKAVIEAVLPDCLGIPETKAESHLIEAAAYSLKAGGKRIRPVLMLSVSSMLKLQNQSVLPFAAAIEMIHTYSLIHDDLPAMDDDDLRRGKPTCHKVYGEAVAILAGDFLLNRAFEIMMDAIDADWPETLHAARKIGAAAGGSGMIGGQVMDMVYETETMTLDQLENMHRKRNRGAARCLC